MVAVDPTSPFAAARSWRSRADAGARRRCRVFIRRWRRAAISAGWLVPRRVRWPRDAAGKDVVLIETVGVEAGRDRYRANRRRLDRHGGPWSRATRCTRQAGIMEIADILVVEQADRERRGPYGGLDRRTTCRCRHLLRGMAAADPEDRGLTGQEYRSFSRHRAVRAHTAGSQGRRRRARAEFRVRELRAQRLVITAGTRARRR